jgi:hypothetical protein
LFGSVWSNCQRQFEALSDLLTYFTREEAEQVGLDGYIIDTFLSDYDEFADEFMPMEPRSPGSVHGPVPLGANL